MWAFNSVFFEYMFTRVLNAFAFGVISGASVADAIGVWSGTFLIANTLALTKVADVATVRRIQTAHHPAEST